ncbi:unnamed protein product, partial [Effrenium voratum]
MPEMPAAQIVPDVICFSAAISSCESERQWQRAVGLFLAMADAAVLPDAVSCNSAVSACAKGHQWHTALLLRAKMRELPVSPTVVTCNAVLEACRRGGQWRRALNALLEAEEEVSALSCSEALPPPLFSSAASFAAVAARMQRLAAIGLERKRRSFGPWKG